MPFPPPPPPPGPPPPPKFPSGPLPSGAADPNERNLLLQSIRKGTTLKKAVTNDRSAPSVGNVADGSRSSSNSSQNSPRSPGSANTRNINSGSATLGRNNGLAGLFAGGMPKLKPTGLDIGQSSNSQSLSSLPLVANNSSLHSKHDGVRKTFSIDVKNRGPPPQPPPANQKPAMPQSASDSVLTGPMHSRSNSTTSLSSTASITHNNGWGSNNNNNNCSNNTNTSNINNNNNISHLHRTVSKAPPGGYGKPNVAPKPPGINTKPSPPPKMVNGRPTVTRAQSMRAPKSPPIAPPTAAMVFPSVGQQTELSRIGTPPSFHQSQDSLLHTPPPPRSGTLPMPRSGAASPNRPRLRAPLTRPPPPPPSRIAMSSPPCPPPPPPSAAAPPPPNVAPPPPPHRAAPSVTGFNNSMSNNSAPPPPPVRNSSMRNGMSPFAGDIESRFLDIFHSVQEFPPPQPFLGKPKVYNSKTAKQQAPLPPVPVTHLQLGNKMWSRDNTSTC